MTTATETVETTATETVETVATETPAAPSATQQLKNAWAQITPETKKDTAKAAVAVGIGAILGAILAS